MEQEPVHKRRVRYKGTHPRTYAEKYKERDPEKYSEDVAKIIQSGKTPAVGLERQGVLNFMNE